MSAELVENSSALPPEMRRRLTVVFVAGAFLLASGALQWLRPQQPSVAALFGLVGLLVVALPIVRQVLVALRASGYAATQFYMDQYVVLAVAACLATGQYLTGGVVAIVLVLGQMLEERTVIGVEYAIARLRELGKLRARKVCDGVEEELDARDLMAGDIIRIRPGEAVPADACIISGEALLDQSNITGESLPVSVSPGARIFAGTRNLNGVLTAEVLETGGDTVLARVQQIVAEAKETEAPIVRMAEDYARYYTPLVLLIGLSVYFFTQDLNRAISVLIVSIPCAFVLASPSALVTAIACASRLGLLVKGARHFEEGRRITTVVFDKTGTLTEGRLSVEEVWLHSDAPREHVLQWAAALERHSLHPVARAIQQAAEELPGTIIATDLEEHAGQGMSGWHEGKQVQVGQRRWLTDCGVHLAPEPPDAATFSLVAVVVDGAHLATLGLADRIRPEAPAALELLREMGVERFLLLSGDRRAVVEKIAAQLGLTEFQAECLPEDKQRRILQEKSAGAKVMVVGDGLNDAPALAAADLSVAMGALGNEVAIHTADVALMSHDLRRLADLLELSHRTVGIINGNLLCGFGFIIAALCASAAGYITPVAAALVHEFGAFFVLFNSARLLRFDGLTTQEPGPVTSLSRPGGTPLLTAQHP